MPIFKIQRDSDKKYLCKQYWKIVPEWDNEGYLFHKMEELRRVQDKISSLLSQSAFGFSCREVYHIVTYDLENMVKHETIANRLPISDLMVGDRLRLSFCDFLPLTQMKRLLKLGFAPKHFYNVSSTYPGFKMSSLKGYNYGYDNIEFDRFPGIKLPYFLFSQA